MHEYSKRIGEHIKSCYSDFNKMNREELDELKAWACVMKDLTEYDINKRGIEAMDEAEQEEKCTVAWDTVDVPQTEDSFTVLAEDAP